jgi:hypothetical protein
MIFSVVMDRSVGAKKTKEENHQSERNGVTFKEFFSRYPSLHPFLLKHLQSCLQENKSSHEDDPAVMQSSIFACLVLLSKLLPSPSENPNDSLSAKFFIPIIRQCAIRPDFGVSSFS